MQESQPTVNQAASSPNNQSAENHAFMMVVEEIKKLRLEVDTLRGQQERHREEREMEEDWEEEEEVEGNEARGWAAVMPPTMTTAQRTAALQLCDCLQSAPPLETVQKLEDKLPKYKGVPSTPPPRRHQKDHQLFVIQKKLEGTMQMIVDHFERGEAHSLQLAAALARSGWEDCQQARRMMLAGKGGGGILERRNDDERPKLLTPEEEQKLRQRRQQQQKARGRDRFRSTPHFEVQPTSFQAKAREKERAKATETAAHRPHHQCDGAPARNPPAMSGEN